VAPSRPRRTPGRATWGPLILEKPLDREADEEPERDGGRGQPGLEKSVHEIASVKGHAWTPVGSAGTARTTT
jgi:hypothetical protein